MVTNYVEKDKLFINTAQYSFSVPRYFKYSSIGLGPKTEDWRLKTEDCRPKTVDCRLNLNQSQVSDKELWSVL